MRNKLGSTFIHIKQSLTVNFYCGLQREEIPIILDDFRHTIHTSSLECYELNKVGSHGTSYDRLIGYTKISR